jgi:hypothetical protein
MGTNIDMGTITCTWMYMAKLCPQNKNVDINLRHMLDVLLELPSLGTPKRQNAGKPNI